MTTAELHTLTGAYALHALPDEERAGSNGTAGCRRAPRRCGAARDRRPAGARRVRDAAARRSGPGAARRHDRAPGAAARCPATAPAVRARRPGRALSRGRSPPASPPRPDSAGSPCGRTRRRGTPGSRRAAGGAAASSWPRVLAAPDARTGAAEPGGRRQRHGGRLAEREPGGLRRVRAWPAAGRQGVPAVVRRRRHDAVGRADEPVRARMTPCCWTVRSTGRPAWASPSNRRADPNSRPPTRWP